MKHRLQLIIRLINNHGFFKTALLLIKMMFYKILNLRFYKKNEERIISAVKGKRVIVFSKALEWNNMFQRIQQMALEFSKRENSVVIYVENCSTHDFFFNINELSKSLFCYSFRHYSKLNELLVGADEVVLYMTNLFEFETNIKLNHQKMVYEYVDELELFFSDMDEATARHKKALEMSDISIATATKLFNQIKPYAKNPLLSPNAVDYDTFSVSKATPIAGALKDIVPKYDVVLGYYGALASWFDFEVIIEVAKQKKNWLFVLIGTLFDDTLSKYPLNQYENILVVGAQPYKSLPSFIKGIDILTIPFVVNNITESTSPVKLFEYMASGVPILTSQLPECKKYQSVYRYNNASDFITQAQMLFDMRNS
ncbi:MAG: glycosyltransferase, partial [Oscillospiraceae bacterium]